MKCISFVQFFFPFGQKKLKMTNIMNMYMSNLTP